MKDTVFNSRMEVVFHNDPEVVRRRLKSTYPEDWDRVCIGETRAIVSIPEYVYRERYDTVVDMLKDAVDKRYSPMFKRKPDKFEAYLKRVALRIIDEVLKP